MRGKIVYGIDVFLSGVAEPSYTMGLDIVSLERLCSTQEIAAIHHGLTRLHLHAAAGEDGKHHEISPKEMLLQARNAAEDLYVAHAGIRRLQFVHVAPHHTELCIHTGQDILHKPQNALVVGRKTTAKEEKARPWACHLLHIERRIAALVPERNGDDEIRLPAVHVLQQLPVAPVLKGIRLDRRLS